MEELTRIGVAIGSDLLARFDRFIAKQGYTNRSEAFRDLIRDRLVSAAVGDPEAPVVGTVTLIYDHHARLLPDKLMDLQPSPSLAPSCLHVGLGNIAQCHLLRQTRR